MTQGSEHLGGRLPLFDPETLEGAAASLYGRIMETVVPWADNAGFQSRTAKGRLIGPFNLMVLSPEICDGFLALQKAEETHTSLSERLRQVVNLTVGSVWEARYELYAHSAVARKAGLDEATIGALAKGQASDTLSREEQIAQRFTRQLLAVRRVGADLYQSAQAALGDKGLVDLIALAGCYQTVCSLLNAFQIPAP